MPKVLINGTGIYYEEYGTGEPLILIQGFAGGANAWFRQVTVFSKKFKVITFDARGLDNSDVSNIPYTVPVMVNDVLGIMDYLKIEKANILGTSLGGLVAQAFAVTCPERLDKLVLVSTFPGTDILKTSPGLKSVQDIRADMDVGKTMGYFISIAFNKRFYRGTINFLSLLRRKWAYNNYFKQMESIGDYNMVERLHLVRAPTLVITGSDDKIVPPANSELLVKNIPGARLIIVKGGSHAFFLEMSGRFNTEVLHFLGE